jgi:hypothetical protein
VPLPEIEPKFVGYLANNVFAMPSQLFQLHLSIVKPGYNDIGLYDISSVPSDILRYELIPVNHNITLLVYNDTKYSAPFMTS